MRLASVEVARSPGRAARRIAELEELAGQGFAGASAVIDDLAAALAAAGRCAICGRLLWDPASLDAGVGPDCSRRVGSGYLAALLARRDRADV